MVDKMMLAEIKEKGKLLNEAIEIIEKLSENKIADTDIETDDYADNGIDEIKRLIIRARILTLDRWWI